MTAQPASLSPKAVAAYQEYTRRRREGGVRYFQPANDRQEAVLRCQRKGCLVLGGNRSGKTVIGAVETTLRLLGKHPYKQTHKGPIKVWACSQMLPGSSDKPHVQLEELKRWIPRDALRGGSWEKAYSPGARTLHLADGSIVEFKSYDQGLLSFESAKVHFVWFDEEPPDYAIFTSCLLRLLDFGGQWIMTMTPVLSLQGKGWVEGTLYENRHDPDVNYEFHQLFTTENVTLDQDEVNGIRGSLSAEEAKVRLEGGFARIGGRVLSELRDDLHYVDPFLPPSSWRHFLIIDPGFKNATAALFAAADSDGALFLYNEHYVKEQLPAYHVEVLDLMHRAHGSPEIDVLMDPSVFQKVGTVLGKSERTIAEEYQIAADKLKAKWFRPRGANNDPKGVMRLKRYLQPRPHPLDPRVQVAKLYICRHLTWWDWEAKRWTWPRDRQGIAGAERPLAEKPIERDNHLMDCTKYLVWEMPDPLEEVLPPQARNWETVVKAHVDAVIRKKQKRFRKSR